jgi:HK97 gp10 family phage protein
MARDVWVELDKRAFAAFRRSPEIEADLRTRVVKVEASARRRSPVETGELRDSIFSEVFLLHGGLVGDIGATALYAGFVEFGHGGVPAHPFLRPALKAGRIRQPRKRTA